jgi:hypothetical protein
LAEVNQREYLRANIDMLKANVTILLNPSTIKLNKYVPLSVRNLKIIASSLALNREYPSELLKCFLKIEDLID